MFRPIRDQRGNLFVFRSALKHKLSRRHSVLPFCQVSSNYDQELQRRCQKSEKNRTTDNGQWNTTEHFGSDALNKRLKRATGTYRIRVIECHHDQ